MSSFRYITRKRNNITFLLIFAKIITAMKYFYTFFFTLLSYALFGQTGPFKNPSFEGPGVGFILYDWKDCELSRSSSNLQPGWSMVTIPAYDGPYYLGMVTRSGICTECNESVYQELKYPLSKDSCYTFDIVINHDSKGYPQEDRKAILRIWGSNNPLEDCGREELLWTSPVPYSDFWRPCTVQMSPSKNFTHITFEAFYSDTTSPINGHILMDYIHNFKAFPKYAGLDLGEDITICRGEETILEVRLPSSQANYPIKWSTGETSSKITAKEPGTYWAEVKSPCKTVRDSIEIKHEKCIFIPNVFTPNNDGKNETFYIKGINKGNWQLKVYDRKGKLVYENNAYKNDWKGDNLPAALYYYRLTNEDTNEDYKGWIQMMK